MCHLQEDNEDGNCQQDGVQQHDACFLLEELGQKENPEGDSQ